MKSMAEKVSLLPAFSSSTSKAVLIFINYLSLDLTINLSALNFWKKWEDSFYHILSITSTLRSWEGSINYN